MWRWRAADIERWRDVHVEVSKRYSRLGTKRYDPKRILTEGANIKQRARTTGLDADQRSNKVRSCYGARRTEFVSEFGALGGSRTQLRKPDRYTCM